MDTPTAQAIHELATTGHLSDDSLKAVSDALGLPRFHGIDAEGKDVTPAGVTADGKPLGSTDASEAVEDAKPERTRATTKA